MKQPQGFIDVHHPNHVCLLERSLYGLKQAPRAWFHRLSLFLLTYGLQESKADSSLFLYHHASDIMLVLVYVDDIIITVSSSILITHFL